MWIENRLNGKLIKCCPCKCSIRIGIGWKTNLVNDNNFGLFPSILFSPIFIEIEAIEACKWLRAAGFPQYAQMYEGKWKNSFQNI